MNKILMIVAPTEFRDEEYFIPKYVFINAGFNVITASKDVNIARGKLGGITNVDIDISNVNVENYEAVVFVGGMGALVYQDDSIINNLILNASSKNKIVAAICIAPVILATSGILKNKNATVFNDKNNEQSKLLNLNGAIYTGSDVEVNGNFITANGPLAAEKFAKKIVEVLND